MIRMTLWSYTTLTDVATQVPMRRWGPKMEVDVVTSIEIARPRTHVAAYVCDPQNATAWYANIRSTERIDEGPLHVGSQIRFVARFLGRTIAYTYEVREFAVSERFVMSTAEGPFPMETTYSFEDAGPGDTRVSLRNRGAPRGFSKVAAPMMEAAMRRANGKDLARLKSILEGGAAGSRQ